MAELYRSEIRDPNGKTLWYERVGYTEDDVRDALLALNAMVIVAQKGPQPRKLDEALSWLECDEKAHAMAERSLSTFRHLLDGGDRAKA